MVYRVGIIGFGMIGKVHAFGYATLPFYSQPLGAEFRVTHIATAHAESAEKARKICGAEHGTTDFREITENPEIDIVHICTPNEDHLEPLISAIQHGKHIYCDKPLGGLPVNHTEYKRFLLAMQPENYAGINQMTFHLRFFPAIQRAKQLLSEGRLGRIYQFRLAYLHASNALPTTPLKWKHSATGGVVRDLGSHLLDLTDHLLGPIGSLLAETQLAILSRPVAAGSSDYRPVESEDAVTILAKTTSGAHGVLEATKLATGNEDELRLEIYGSAGALRFSLMDPHYLEFFDATASDRPLGGESGWRRIPSGGRFEPPCTDFPSPKSTQGWIRAHTACLANFLSCIAEHRPAEPNLMQGYKVDRLIDSVFLSAQKQTWVPCPTE